MKTIKHLIIKAFIYSYRMDKLAFEIKKIK